MFYRYKHTAVGTVPLTAPDLPHPPKKEKKAATEISQGEKYFLPLSGSGLIPLWPVQRIWQEDRSLDENSTYLCAPVFSK